MKRYEAVIFLDIDGVLNDHTRHPNGYCGIKAECVYRLNRIIAETGAALVISSAWRYQMVGGAVTGEGFRYLLMIHGLDYEAVILGRTADDERIPGRGEQINEWLRQYSRVNSAPAYVVLDDGSDERPRHPETMTLSESLRLHHADRWVRTKGDIGLADADADRAIEILRASGRLDGPVNRWLIDKVTRL